MEAVLELRNISKSFRQGATSLEIIRSSSLVVYRGESVACVGPSGCGKTTLLQMCGLLDSANSGDILINGQSITSMDDAKKTKIRRDNIGFVYQYHHLLPEFSALENVMMPSLIQGKSVKNSEKKARELIARLDMSHRIDHRPAELSGGEQQRIAIARAVVNRPSLILADEPTGNLDPQRSEEVANLLLGLVKEYGLSLLFITHNMDLARKTDRIVTIRDGVVGEL